MSNHRGLDENSISVPCQIEGCWTRVNGAVRCRAHGGDPEYQWSTDLYGGTQYTVKEGAKPNGTTTAN